jgi:hypothetical protein
VDSSPLVENPYIVPPSPRINGKEMIQKYDGQNPAGSTKIMETILKSKGYVKQDNKYGNIWTNKKYERILKATKKVKDAPKQDGKGGPGWLDSLADKVIPARTVKFDRDAMPQQDAVMENTAAPILNNPQPEQTNTSSPGMFSKLLDTVNPSRTAKFDRSLLPPETQAVPVQPPKVAPTPTPAPAPAPAPAPQKSGFSLPKITLPKMPKMTMPEMPSAPQMPDLPKMPQMPELPKVSELFGGGTYNVRGIKVNDNDIEEAAKILYAEISNRSPEKQAFEIRHIINTALNRSLNPGLDKGKSLTQVLQRRAQYQGYAPNGMTVKGGKVVKSQYQLVSEGKLRPDQQKKYEHIKNILNELKNGNFEDTTGGAQFYVHASDGTLWLGQTINEAKNNANKHEKAVKSQTTKWGTAVGMPAEIAKI